MSFYHFDMFFPIKFIYKISIILIELLQYLLDIDKEEEKNNRTIAFFVMLLRKNLA